MDKEGLVSHLFKEARRHVETMANDLRLLEIVSNKIYRIVPEDQPLEHLIPQLQRSYRLEVTNCSLFFCIPSLILFLFIHGLGFAN